MRLRIRNPGAGIGLDQCLQRLTINENTASVQGSILAVIQQSGVLRTADDIVFNKIKDMP